ncbi:MAG: NTP transferase domain-containing protein [Methanocellales archaeon]|nr:NTP transferase domain-containing protein [Methanocellales archaeon]MDD3291492.1 NTP transferase domain-containing protein [Methanocellales archaeon]MDD5234618.1 NTP transferase domain-containing protein [Methanocellales archaeon]MDD5485029.1 NTP transferase domain-containing protein [Methanocellales archaeon]
MDALVMAGGPGTRLCRGEKPLIELQGRAMISYVLDALLQSEKVDEIFVVTSPHTLKTKKHLEGKFPVIETRGVGYVPDLIEAAEILGLKSPFLIVMADLPLLDSKLIDEVICVYQKANKPALSVYVPLKVCNEIGRRPDIVLNREGRLIVPVGLNILDGRLIREEQDEHLLIMGEPALAVNVNTTDDLKIWERFVGKRM